MNARFILTACTLFAAVVSQSPACAQTPPSAAEIASYTGLLGVTQSGAHNEIRQLLVNGLDPNSRDGNGRTPYLVAAYRGDIVAMELLVKGGADPRAKDNQNYDAITILAVANRLAAMKAAIALGGNPREITSPYQGTALIAAAHLGHADVVKALIGAGAPLDHVNNLGWTAVIESIVLGDGGANHQRCLRDLLAAGANPNLADRSGVTPLKLAEGRGYGAMADMLRAKGGR
jgi:ankyrin repeat protein